MPHTYATWWIISRVDAYKHQCVLTMRMQAIVLSLIRFRPLKVTIPLFDIWLSHLFITSFSTWVMCIAIPGSLWQNKIRLWHVDRDCYPLVPQMMVWILLLSHWINHGTTAPYTKCHFPLMTLLLFLKDREKEGRQQQKVCWGDYNTLQMN